MKKVTVIIILAIIIGVLIGIYVYKTDNVKDNKGIQERFATVDDECTKIARLSNEEKSKLQTTDNTEIKVSPNTIIIKNVQYNQCKHLINKNEKANENMVNKTKEEFAEKYKDWEIEEFTTNKIVLYKEIDEFCNEHYMLKDKSGYIIVYQLDKEDNEFKIYKNTEIETKYLSEEDIIRLKEGIKVYTNTELNKKIEDFE